MGVSSQKKAKTVSSARKVVATVSGDSQGVVLMDYLVKGKTTTEYYAAFLNDDINSRHQHLAKKNVFFITTIHTAHTSSFTVAKLHDLHFELSHAPYSPDLPTSDFSCSEYEKCLFFLIWSSSLIPLVLNLGSAMGR